MKSRGELINATVNGMRLCYIDPPFATRQEFQGRRGARAYRDKVAGAAFVEFLRKRLVFIYELLTDGRDAVPAPGHAQGPLHEGRARRNLRRAELPQRGHLEAHERPLSADRYGPVHDSILVYAKSHLLSGVRSTSLHRRLSRQVLQVRRRTTRPDAAGTHRPECRAGTGKGSRRPAMAGHRPGR